MTSNFIRLYLTKFLISVIETSKELGTIVAAYSQAYTIEKLVFFSESSFFRPLGRGFLAGKFKSAADLEGNTTSR